MEIKFRALIRDEEKEKYPYNYRLLSIIDDNKEMVSNMKHISSSKTISIKKIQNDKAIPFSFYKAISRVIK